MELTGDNNKIHVDEKFAATTSFKKPVVHGMLGASFISTIIGTKYENGVYSNYKKLEISSTTLSTSSSFIE